MQQTGTENHRSTHATPPTEEEPATPPQVTLEQALRQHLPAWAYWKPFTVADASDTLKQIQGIVEILVVDDRGHTVDSDTTVGWLVRWTTPTGQWGIGISAATGDGRYKYQIKGPNNLCWGTVDNETATVDEIITRLHALGVIPDTGGTTGTTSG